MKIREEMVELVHEFETSGQTQKFFSESTGIGFHKFNYWYRMLKREAVTPEGFHKIENHTPRSTKNCKSELVYPNGVVLRGDSADLDLVSRLIRLY